MGEGQPGFLPRKWREVGDTEGRWPQVLYQVGWPQVQALSFMVTGDRKEMTRGQVGLFVDLMARV